jgi:hypothetical protein
MAEFATLTRAAARSLFPSDTNVFVVDDGGRESAFQRPTSPSDPLSSQDDRGTAMQDRYIISDVRLAAWASGASMETHCILTIANTGTLLDSEEPFARDPGADRYTYRRAKTLGSKTREIPESVLPSAVASVVTPEIDHSARPVHQRLSSSLS